MMEHIRKHARAVVRAARHPHLPHPQRLREVALEMIIIIFAVSVSIGLHACRERAREQAEVRAFLASAKENLTKDISTASDEKKRIGAANEHFGHLLEIKSDATDIPSFMTVFHVITVKLNTASYEGFKSSGKLGLIEDEPLKQALLNSYQHRVPQVHEINALHSRYALQALDMATAEVGTSRAESYQAPRTKNTLRVLILFGETTVATYDREVARAARSLVDLIEAQLAAGR